MLWDIRFQIGPSSRYRSAELPRVCSAKVIHYLERKASSAEFVGEHERLVMADAIEDGLQLHPVVPDFVEMDFANASLAKSPQDHGLVFIPQNLASSSMRKIPGSGAEPQCLQ